MIATMGNKYQNRQLVKSRKYCLLKEQWLKHGNLHKPKTEEHKQKLRAPKTDEHKKALSLSRIGKSWGHKHSNETKSKMSTWQKGIPKPTLTCEHCNKTISDLNYKRWHGNNCKLVLLQ